MNNFKIEKGLSEKVLSIGVYYKDNTPGGMASVIDVYSKNISPFKYIPTWKDGHMLVKLYYAIFSLLNLISYLTFDKKIEIVHVHGAAYSSFYRKSILIKICKLYKKKVIFHIHAGAFIDFYTNSKNKQKILNTLLNIDILIVLSRYWANFFEQIGIDSSKIRILNNPIEYPTKSSRSQLHEDTILNLLFLGVIKKEKGIFDLVHVIQENKSRYQNKLRLHIGGAGYEFEELKDYINTNELNNLVSMYGWVTGERKINLLTLANVYILPSYYEGLPVSILEAMSYDCAIIATNVGGIPDIVHNQENGLLIEPGKEKSIKESLDLLLEDTSLAHKFGINSRKIVEKYYSVNVFSSLSQIYQELIEK